MMTMLLGTLFVRCGFPPWPPFVPCEPAGSGRGLASQGTAGNCSDRFGHRCHRPSLPQEEQTNNNQVKATTVRTTGSTFLSVLALSALCGVFTAIAQDIGSMPPVEVKTVPESGAKDVAPGTVEIRVTFSKEMTDNSWSWSSGWQP
jgi:hypothetical protein